MATKASRASSSLVARCAARKARRTGGPNHTRSSTSPRLLPRAPSLRRSVNSVGAACCVCAISVTLSWPVPMSSSPASSANTSTVSRAWSSAAASKKSSSSLFEPSGHSGFTPPWNAGSVAPHTLGSAPSSCTSTNGSCRFPKSMVGRLLARTTCTWMVPLRASAAAGADSVADVLLGLEALMLLAVLLLDFLPMQRILNWRSL